MDNRVSKSIAWIKVIVKEQRVDGSWYKKIFFVFKVYSTRFWKKSFIRILSKQTGELVYWETVCMINLNAVYGQMSLWGKFKLMSTLCVSVNENKPDKKFMAMFIGLCPTHRQKSKIFEAGVGWGGYGWWWLFWYWWAKTI